MTISKSTVSAGGSVVVQIRGCADWTALAIKVRNNAPVASVGPYGGWSSQPSIQRRREWWPFPSFARCEFAGILTVRRRIVLSDGDDDGDEPAIMTDRAGGNRAMETSEVLSQSGSIGICGILVAAQLSAARRRHIASGGDGVGRGWAPKFSHHVRKHACEPFMRTFHDQENTGARESRNQSIKRAEKERPPSTKRSLKIL